MHPEHLGRPMGSERSSSLVPNAFSSTTHDSKQSLCPLQAPNREKEVSKSLREGLSNTPQVQRAINESNNTSGVSNGYNNVSFERHHTRESIFGTVPKTPLLQLPSGPEDSTRPWTYTKESSLGYSNSGQNGGSSLPLRENLDYGVF